MRIPAAFRPLDLLGDIAREVRCRELSVVPDMSVVEFISSGDAL